MNMQDPTELVAQTADGRILTGRSFGPASGVPLLFIAGAGTGKSMRFGDDLLASAHIRILTMDRPGMTGSDPHQQRSLDTTVDDYRTFIENAIGESRIPVVANSQGSVFGLGAAVAGWASRLVLVSPADDVSRPEIRALLPTVAARLAVLAETNPDEAAEIFRTLNPESMERMVLAGASESDRDFYSSQAFLQLYRKSLAEGFANGGAGYVRDTLIAMQPWGLPLEQIRIPVTVFFGDEDDSHSPDHGRTLALRIPGTHRRIFPNIGGALLWTHAQSVLEAACS